jgi:hypothetical protein
MTQHYSRPEREADPHALPDIEVWQDRLTIIRSRCGEFTVGRGSENARGFCPSCGRATCVDDLDTDPEVTGILHTARTGWFYWFCFPGCLPEGEPVGPFATEAEALACARGNGGLGTCHETSAIPTDQPSRRQW